MNVEFVDTNILVYAHDNTAGAKQDRARELFARLWDEGAGAISTQVLAEFYSVVTRKFSMSREKAEAAVASLGVWTIHRPRHSDLLRAIDLQQRYKISWWDALIVNSAAGVAASVLWSEDFGDRRRFGPVLVRNPFL